MRRSTLCALVVFLVTLGLAGPAASAVDVELLAGLKARSIGPAGMSGRIAVIEAQVDNPDVVYVGAATGGLWKSLNGGLTWKPIFDDQPVAAIGAIAIDPSNPDVIWVGTGEGNTRNSVSVGNGIYRSLDGGDSWEHLGLEKSERIHRIYVHPHDPNVVWVAALGALWGENEQRGVFKTSDGGKSWRKVLYVDERTGAADLVLDPRNPQKLFAAMWEHRRWPWFFKSGGPGSGLHVTYDGGESWKRLSPKEGLPEGELGRIGVAISRDFPEVVYALVEAETSALLRSDDGGRTFRSVNQDPDVADRPFYYADIRVDPQWPNRVYNLASRVRVSDDGGKSFEILGESRSIHGDYHSLWINPKDPTHLLIGNDGGMGISHDRGATWRFVTNLPLAQFYHVAVDMERPYNVYGGMQDNGSWRGPSAVEQRGGINDYRWVRVGGGDGFDTLPDPENAQRGYAMWQGGHLSRFDLESGESKSIQPPPAGDVELRFNWNAALAIDPFDPATIYYGSQFVHRSRDRGDTWEVISLDLTSNNPEWQKQAESGGLTPDVTGAENFTTLIAIAPSPVERGVIWVGSDDGRLHVTRDGGESWRSVEGNLPGVPANTWIPHVKASSHDAGEAYVVLDDHRRSNWTPYLYRTRDFGASWQSLATDDLRGYALSIEQDPVDPQLLFLGTEFGLWISVDGGAGWARYAHGVPTVSVHDLVVHPRDHDLVIGTHGRAAYVIDDLAPLRGLRGLAPDTPLHLFPVPPAHQYLEKQQAQERGQGSGSFTGENRPYGTPISFWAGGEHLPSAEELAAEEEGGGRGGARRRGRGGRGSRGGGEEAEEEGAEEGEAEPEAEKPATEVKIQIADAAGEVVRTLTHKPHRGLNRLVWDLGREPLKRPGGGDGGFFGNRSGPQVRPGDYKLTLSLGNATAEGWVEVKPDAFAAGNTEDDWLAREAAIARASGLLAGISEAVDRIGEVRTDLEVLGRKAKQARERAEQLAAKAGVASTASDAPADPFAEFQKRMRGLEKKLDAVEDRLWTRPGQKGIQRRSQVDWDVNYALGGITAGWGAPTPTDLIQLDRATLAVEEALAAADQLLGEEVGALRALAVEAGLELLPEELPGARKDPGEAGAGAAEAGR